MPWSKYGSIHPLKATIILIGSNCMHLVEILHLRNRLLALVGLVGLLSCVLQEFGILHEKCWVIC